MNKVYASARGFYIVDDSLMGVYIGADCVANGNRVASANLGKWNGQATTGSEPLCTLPELHEALLLLKERQDEPLTISPSPF